MPAPLTDAQRWVLSLGGVRTELNGDRHDLLGGAPRLLGSAAAYEVLVQEWAAPTEAALVVQLDRLFATADDDPQLAFDLGRLATIAGFGYVAYLLEAPAAWAWLLRAARRVQARFPGFRAFGLAYLEGRERQRAAGRSLGQAPATADQARAALDRLLGDAASPWVRVPYATRLAGARAPREAQRVLRVGRAANADAQTIGAALALARPGDRIVVAAGTYHERLRVSTAAWDAAPTDAARARAATAGATARARPKRPGVPPAPSVEIVGAGRVVLTSPAGPVIEVDDGGLLLEGLTLINARPRPSPGHSDTAVFVIDGFLRMVGCTIRARAGIGLTTFGATQLEACTIDRCGAAGVSAQGITVMRGGQVRGCGAEGVIADDEADVELAEVRVHGCGNAGLHVTGSGTLVARGCTLERNTVAGARATAGGELMLAACTIRGTDGAGVRVTDDGALEAVACLIDRSGGAGLDVEATQRIVVRDCKIRGSKASGVAFRTRAAGTLEACEVTRSGSVSVELADRSEPRFADCAIGGARTSGGGVYAHGGAGGHFTRCTIEATRFQAIRLDDGATSAFIDCTIHGAEDGVLVHGRSSGRFLRCTIRDAAGPGVRIWDRSDPRFESCRIEGSGEANIAIQRAGRGIFVDCAVVGAGLAGLEVAARGAPIVRGGSITDSGGAGIAVTGGTIDVEGCELARNDLGIHFDGGTGRVVGCAIHHARIAGVFVSAGARPRIEACDVFANDSAGIELDGARTAPHVEGCDVHDNEHAIHAYGGARGTITAGAIGGGRGYALYVEDSARPALDGVLIRPGDLGAIFDERQRATLTRCRTGAGAFVRPWPAALDAAPGEVRVYRTRAGAGCYLLWLGPDALAALGPALAAHGLEPGGRGLARLVAARLERDRGEPVPDVTFACEVGAFSASSPRRASIVRIAATVRAALDEPAISPPAQRPAARAPGTVHDPVLGALTYDEGLGGHVSEARPVRFLRGHRCRIVLVGYADDARPDELHAAVRRALAAGPALLRPAQPHVVQYRADLLALGGGAGRDAPLGKPSDVWAHVQFGDELRIRRRARGDADDGIYLALACACAWDVEHGLHLVLRADGAIRKVGPINGHLTNADAYADPALIGVVYKRLGAASPRRARVTSRSRR